MKRERIASALTLIGIGGWFLAVQFSPALNDFAYGPETWPMPIIAIGLGLAVIGILTWTPGMFVPASIISGIGSLLYWQNSTGNWGSWAYAWTLIIGFVGIGLALSGTFGRNRGEAQAGGWMIFNSLLLFGIFGAFLGGGDIVSRFWPVLLIGLGLLLLWQGLFKRR